MQDLCFPIACIEIFWNSAWFSIQGTIQNTTCSVGFRIQRIIQLYHLQRLVHYSGYYSKYDLQCLVQDSAYY